MKTFQLDNVIKKADSQVKIDKLKKLGYKEIKELKEEKQSPSREKKGDKK